MPFFHSNDDFDEVIFYHAGDFFSRDNIHPGMMTFHPSGFTHGPHPKAFAAGAKAAKTMTDEVAVMIDARDRWTWARRPKRQEDKAYADSWKAEMKLASLKQRPRRHAGRRIARSDALPSPWRTSRRRCRRRWMTGTDAAPQLEARLRHC